VELAVRVDGRAARQPVLPRHAHVVEAHEAGVGRHLRHCGQRAKPDSRQRPALVPERHGEGEYAVVPSGDLEPGADHTELRQVRQRRIGQLGCYG